MPQIAGLRATLIVIVIVIGITSWASTARIIRSQTLSVKERMFVDRARVIGSGNGHIMIEARPAERHQPHRRERRPRLRRGRLHRDDARVHRPGRPVRAVLGPDPQLGRSRRCAGTRGVVVHRPAGDLRGPRHPRVHARRQRPRRHPQPEVRGPPMSGPTFSRPAAARRRTPRPSTPRVTSSATARSATRRTDRAARMPRRSPPPRSRPRSPSAAAAAGRCRSRPTRTPRCSSSRTCGRTSPSIPARSRRSMA